MLGAAAWLAAGAQEVVDYQQVAPIFAARCVVCHSGTGAPRELRLDSYAGIRAGSARGPVAVPGAPGQSELVRRIRGDSQPRMPLTGPPYLSDDEIALIERWIAGGMPGADVTSPAAVPAAPPAGPPPVATWAHVAPIFLKRCAKCHADNGQMGAPPEGLRLTSYQWVLAGSERVVVVPGHPNASELVRRIKGWSTPPMPFDGPPYLPAADVALIEQWVAQGARDEAGDAAPVPSGRAVRLGGTLTGQWELDGLPLIVDRGTRLRKAPRVGERAQVRGVVGSDGSIAVSRIRRR